MAYTPPEYPAAVPEYLEVWPWADDVDDVNVAAWDAMVKEIRAIMTELGTLPKGAKADVKTRLDDVDTALALPISVNTRDPAAVDYDQTDLTLDGTWRELDLNTDVGVPTNASEVSLYCLIRDNAINQYLFFRREGNANAINVSRISTIVAAVNTSGDFNVPCKLGKIEYNGNAGTDIINIAIKGWRL